MVMVSVNPSNGQSIASYDPWEAAKVEQALAQVDLAGQTWRRTPLAQRCEMIRQLARVLRQRKADLGRLISLEMGKLITEAEAEVEKCALCCDFYAEHAPDFLVDEQIESDAGKSYVAYQALGCVLGVMPWNFPVWQVLRFAIPTLLAGNTVVIKHASNVPQCGQAIENLFPAAGFPESVFRNLMLGANQVAAVIADSRVHAVSLTGSENAGRRVAASAGQHLKKTVLELGGSDAFVVMPDAELDSCVKTALLSRFANCGQSCIAAKRFIVDVSIADDFIAALKSQVETWDVGADPLDPASSLAPMAREDLRQELHDQVERSLAAGARLVSGGRPHEGPGFYYPPTILDAVAPGMPAYAEELFGPVAAVIRVANEKEALSEANASAYGLGGSVWSADKDRAEAFARQVETGAMFVNGLVKSDPRLPFGGIKASGYGRELSLLGIREFVNAKTIWVR